ncbi:MAG: cytochrome c [Sorangiineae bacterium]|nr:cytochrome c [Polyangiaceae bacterium]MEB2321190.1 cytochrome c [Sorangiineae bacterium]
MTSRALSLILLALGLLSVGCSTERDEARPSSSAAPFASAAPATLAPGAAERAPGDVERGRALALRFECNRCHEGTGLAAPETAKACVGCHQEIIAGTFKAPKSALARWRPNLLGVEFAPSLAATGKRLRRDWIEAYLLAPRDLRPGLVSTMPRLALSRAEARDLAAYLVRDAGRAEPASLEGADLGRGRELLETKACGACHTFSGVEALPIAPSPEAGRGSAGIALAPDLRFARERFEPARLVAWLLDPPAVKPGTPMPKLGFTKDEARDLAAYILETPLAPLAQTQLPARLPLLDRPVRFAEVQERVLGKICQHCHGNPDVALGDGGPGNTGGFGFRPRRLELTSHRAVSAGLLDDHGERRSVFEKTADGTPLLVAALLARRAEEAGKFDPAVRGMPLGLPPLPAEDIQLVESWVAQGRPR